MKRLLLSILLIMLVFFTASAQKIITLTSPDKTLLFNFKLINTKPFYSIAFKGKVLVDYSSLSLIFQDDSFTQNIKISKPFFKDTTEDYNLITGKTSHVHTQYKQVTIPMYNASQKRINLVVCAFNDGIAFRYEFPQQKDWTSYTLLDENTTFKLADNPTVHTLMFDNYTSSHEGVYQTVPFNQLPTDTLMDMPALFEFPNNTFMAITEASLVNYAGMYLSRHNDVLVSKLSPLPNQTAIKVKADLPHKTPWRVMLISDRIGALIESNMLTSLCDPTKIKDVSWLKPGKCTFPWWNGNVVPDTINAPGNNFVTNKYYIDFCARNNIQYHSVVE